MTKTIKFKIRGFHSNELKYFFLNFFSLIIQIKTHHNQVAKAAHSTHINLIKTKFAIKLKTIATKIIFTLSFTLHTQAIKLKFICNK
ncbi:MAG: hypothetical protein LBQ24_00685 [Candidatus Peribacteria bacterium]|nr:hypothetical protein [Candidatus Peribacteria bacterium]